MNPRPYGLLGVLLVLASGCTLKSEEPDGVDTGGAGGDSNRGGDAGDAGATQACEDEPLDCDDCPTLESFRASCASAFVTTCGGTMVRPVGLSPSEVTSYCYASDGTLTGKIVEVDVPHSRSVDGSDCEAEGTAMSLCSGASIITAESEAIEIHWFNFFAGGYRFKRRLDQLSPEQLGLAQAINIVPGSDDCWEDAVELAITVTGGDTVRAFSANEFNGHCGRDVTLVEFEAASALLHTAHCLSAKGYDGGSPETAPSIVPDDGCWHGLFNSSGPESEWWFRTDIPAAGEYQISFDACGDRGLRLDLFEDDATTEVASTSSEGECPVLTHTFNDAGSYVLRVEKIAGTYAGDFFMALESTSAQ